MFGASQCAWGARGAYLDYRDDKTSNIAKLGHVDGEVLELVLLGLFEDQLGSLAHGMDAAQIAGGVECWVGRLWQRDVWEARGPGAVWSGARGPQGAI